MIAVEKDSLIDLKVFLGQELYAIGGIRENGTRKGGKVK
jgi:hypothetical protein